MTGHSFGGASLRILFAVGLAAVLAGCQCNARRSSSRSGGAFPTQSTEDFAAGVPTDNVPVRSMVAEPDEVSPGEYIEIIVTVERYVLADPNTPEPDYAEIKIEFSGDDVLESMDPIVTKIYEGKRTTPPTLTVKAKNGVSGAVIVKAYNTGSADTWVRTTIYVE